MRRKSLWSLGHAAVVALALLAAPAAQAQVQGLYYQEVAKEGRIYVFNTPERYKAWSESGEVGTALTLIGRGPNGETVVAENETAADLFFFKHGLPGYERPTPAPASLPFDVSWKDGKTTIKSKSAELKISNRLQVRFTSEDLDDASSNQPERESFRIRRMKTKFEGWVYSKDLEYELQLNWADTANPLEDANVNYDLTHGRKNVMLKAGQYKVPFGRQELTSSGSQQFVDRSAVSNAFARGRDVGLQLWGLPAKGKLDWRIGVFNGNGRTVSRNDNDDLQLDARVMWQPFGDVKYSESDFESSDKPLLAIGVGYESNTFPIAASGSTPVHEDERTILGYDVAFKFKGFSVFAEVFDREHDRNGGVSDFDDEGLHGQLGYFVLPATFEIAVRWAELDPNSDVDGDDQTEKGLGLNWFFNKHNHKLQADYREIENEARDTKDREVRLQYQVIF